MFKLVAAPTTHQVNSTGFSHMAISNKLFKLVIVVLLLEAAEGHCLVELQPQRDTVIANASCLDQKLKGIGSAPPQFKHGKYKVKGIQQPYLGPEGNIEIFLLFYGEHDRSATLYSSFLREKHNGLAVYIGQWSTFKLEHGSLVSDELPGGLGTHKRILDVFQKVQRQTPLFLGAGEMLGAKSACIWQP